VAERTITETELAEALDRLGGEPPVVLFAAPEKVAALIVADVEAHRTEPGSQPTVYDQARAEVRQMWNTAFGHDPY
jgi:hypothetical protein